MSWISVKDRLPNDAEEVLVSIRHGEQVAQAYYIKSIKLWFGSSVTREIMADGLCSDAKVDPQDSITHWMPLPEPPKEDNG